MRAVVQRVTRASVAVGSEMAGAIGPGFLVLLGVRPDDTPATADRLAGKIAKLRVFPDPAGKMNRSLADVGGAVLAVSQFTLYADTGGGNRPSFTAAAGPAHADPLYERFVSALRAAGVPVATGRFGEHMSVTLVNDGPVTIIIDMD